MATTMMMAAEAAPPEPEFVPGMTAITLFSMAMTVTATP
jgi:hypothetical protein